MKARVLVRLKPSILNTQNITMKHTLASLGFAEVQDVRVGKVVDVELDGLGPEDARRRVDEMCARLLCNPVIEDFSVELLADPR